MIIIFALPRKRTATIPLRIRACRALREALMEAEDL
jgi:hypothetical protein